MKKICGNCKHMLWGVALGIGARCGHPSQSMMGKGLGPIIPSREFTCDLFEQKNIEQILSDEIKESYDRIKDNLEPPL